MKKISLLLIIFSCITITHSSSAMFRRLFNAAREESFNCSRILIPRGSLGNMQNIENDYEMLCQILQTKYKEQKSFLKKPSDLIKGITLRMRETKRMHADRVFFQEDIDFLDSNFDKLSSQHGPDYAWENALFLIHTKLENECDKFKDYELVHGAALVSLKQKGNLPKSAKILDTFFGGLNNPVEFDIKHWHQQDKKTILEKIKHRESILAKE